MWWKRAMDETQGGDGGTASRPAESEVAPVETDPPAAPEPSAAPATPPVPAPHTPEAHEHWKGLVGYDAAMRNEAGHAAGSSERVQALAPVFDPPAWSIPHPPPTDLSSHPHVASLVAQVPPHYQPFAHPIVAVTPENYAHHFPLAAKGNRPFMDFRGIKWLNTIGLPERDLAKGDERQSLETLVHEIGHKVQDELPQRLADEWESIRPEGEGYMTHVNRVYGEGGDPSEAPPTQYAFDKPTEDFADSFATHVLGPRAHGRYPQGGDGTLSPRRREFFRRVEDWARDTRVPTAEEWAARKS